MKIRVVLLMLLSLALLRAPVDRAMAALLPDVTVNAVPQCIAGMIASLLLLGLPALLLRPWTSPRLRRTRSVWPGVALGVSAALLTRLAMTPVDSAWQTALMLAPQSVPLPESVPLALLYAAALAVVPAVTEEAFFRGAVLSSLLDGSRRVTAVLLTTAAFALMHMSPANLPSLLALSLMLTLLMLHTGYIAVPMAAHFVYNLTALSGFSLPVWVCIASGAALIALGVYLCARQPKVAHRPMKWPDGLIAAAALGVMLVGMM